MRIGIVGFGHVGTAMNKLFPDAVIYDEPKRIGTRRAINLCEVVFVCVPTPANEDGSCDTSIVEDVISWLECDVICLRSTVPVGFTDRMIEEQRKHVCFQPEYYGETVAHPFANIREQGWITIGGYQRYVKKVVNAYKQIYTSDLRINIVDPCVAELAKYMENCYLAMKVTFCNEFYDLAEQFGVDYDKLRETWLLDPRIGRSHTFVYEDDRGFGGSCLPKDTSALVYQGQKAGVDVSLMEAVIAKNEKLIR